VDAVAACGTIALALCLQAGLIVSPRDRPFSRSDPSLLLPHLSDAEVGVSWRTLAAYSLAAPLILILVVDGLLRRTRGERTMRRMLHVVVGEALVVLTCAVLQIAAAAPTPDYVARCKPAGPAPSAYNPLVTLTVATAGCTGEPSEVVLGRMSFPNTVSAVSLYALTLVSLYLRNHVYVRRRRRRGDATDTKGARGGKER
jgi:hypothetical protein